MDDATRADIVDTGWRIHDAVEQSLLRHPAIRGGEGWQDKQRLLLADMAIHLLQTALAPGDIRLDKLGNNLHAILTVADSFLPHAGLKDATGNLHRADDAG